ncbi:permease [Mobilitalea sibirica]|uniref:Permease n=1 Tax=Mobilitalea sibirica TaxID=1462919 RepID=A0A8J7KSZ0_9FIRM|nr:permease [Mobilitalea sibirica]MBH1940791.1 permease [Mobilitalea sibirica]
MNEIFSIISKETIKAILQLGIGTILSALIYKKITLIYSDTKNNMVIRIGMILAGSVLGMILPLNIYGVFPIVIAILAAGLPLCVGLPILISNSLFNLSIPYLDQTFVWRTGGYRIGLAFLAGIIGGLILNRWKISTRSIVKEHILLTYEQQKDASKITTLISKNISSTGLYLIVGVIINVLFQQYLLWSIIEYIINNPGMSSVAMYFAGLNVVNPIFILAMNIVNMFMNLIFLSGIFAFFKLKGIILFVAYYALLVGILGISAYF